MESKNNKESDEQLDNSSTSSGQHLNMQNNMDIDDNQGMQSQESDNDSCSTSSGQYHNMQNNMDIDDGVDEKQTDKLQNTMKDSDSIDDDEDDEIAQDYVHNVGDNPPDCVNSWEFLNYHMLSLDFATNCNPDNIRNILVNIMKHELKDEMKQSKEYVNAKTGTTYKWDEYFLIV